MKIYTALDSYDVVEDCLHKMSRYALNLELALIYATTFHGHCNAYGFYVEILA